MNSKPLDGLLDIMRRLRAEGGCPWDREQDLQSLKRFLIEECYEVLDAVDGGNPARHKEELGDLLLQIVFQAQIRQEEGAFTFDDVVRHVVEKLIRRHPHVFGNTQVSGTADVLINWDHIKAQEKGTATGTRLDGVPRHLPALMKADQVQTRAARVGFDWSDVRDVVAKMEEELAEVKEALEKGDRDLLGQELGDLLFAVVNLSRFQKMSAEELLARTVDKFIRRFREMELRLVESGRQLRDCTLEEMNAAWNAVKDQEMQDTRVS